MKTSVKRLIISFAAPASIAALTVSALAAGPYDGTWQFSAPPAGNASTSDVAECDGVQLQVQIKDNQVSLRPQLVR